MWGQIQAKAKLYKVYYLLGARLPQFLLYWRREGKI